MVAISKINQTVLFITFIVIIVITKDFSQVFYLSIPLFLHSFTDFMRDNDNEGWRMIVIFSSIFLMLSVILLYSDGCKFNYICAFPLLFVNAGNYIISILSAVIVSICHMRSETYKQKTKQKTKGRYS